MMAFKYAGMVLARRSHLGIRLESEFKLLQSQVSRVSSQAGYDPLKKGFPHQNDNSNSQAGDDENSNVRDTTETVKEGITNVIDTAQAIGESTKKVMDTMWESANNGANTVKDKIKDGGNARSREDAQVAGESGIDNEWKRRLNHGP